jgi:hypothetical protein
MPKSYLTDSDLSYPTSSPVAAGASQIPLLKRLQSNEDGTDDEASLEKKEYKGKPRGSTKSILPWLTSIILPELPLALWAPSKTIKGIRIPPQACQTPQKRKHRDRSPDSHSLTSTISPVPKLPPKKKRKPKHTMAEQEASSEPEILVQRRKGKTKHHSRGRPPKDLQSCDFSVHAFVEIANPPKLHRGKSHKTDKYVAQEPTTEGPFTFTHDMSWPSFVLQVAELAGLENENVVLTQMTWHFQGKTKSLPLGNVGGFTAMVTQIRALKVGASAIIMVGLPIPPPKPSRGGRNAPTAEDMNVTGSGGSGAMWDEKVCDFCIHMACTYVYVLKGQSR